jgi:ABC-type polysaccharide/polyol phosphate transport system ATPase subunit
LDSTTTSEVLLSIKNLKIYFELEHYQHQSVRDVFVSALANPVDYILKKPELLYVIDDVSLEITRGSRMGIIGTNGSGKTTLCRAIAGMITAHQGSITKTKEIRAIFDTGTGVIPILTGRENAYLLARLFYPEVKELRDIVEEAIEFSELGHFIDIPFTQYSKGMQSRLLLSLISAVPSEILILDEVLDGADVFFQKKLALRMQNFIRKAGATIFVSHSLEQIRQVCNEILVLHKGKVHFRGDVEQGWKEYLRLQSPS